MSILSQISTGGLLEKPKGQTTRCQETEEALTKRLLAGLLPAQKEFIDDDELVEITPENIRVRKLLLKESARKRA